METDEATRLRSTRRQDTKTHYVSSYLEHGNVWGPERKLELEGGCRAGKGEGSSGRWTARCLQ